MAKRVRDATLESRTAREKLPARGKPYYKAIGQGLHLGYRKGKTGGRWVVRLYAGDQNYRVETVADADDRLDANGKAVLDFWQAQEKARSIHREMSGDLGKVAGHYTVKSAIDDYLDWMEDKRKSSRGARYHAEALILPALGGKDIAKLTADDIRKWQRTTANAPRRVRTGKGQAQRFREASDDADDVRRRRATTNRVLTILKAALNYAWREGKVASDREWRRVEPFQDVEVARVRYLTVEEARRMLNASEPVFRNPIQAALQTGARYGELAALRVEDFNSDAGTVSIRRSKSGKARHVVVTEEGRAFFETICAGRAHDTLMLTTRSGGPWCSSSQQRPMGEACTNGRINPPIGFHGLRHTWASLAVMNGVPLMVVARNLGHADTRMVEKHYGHLSPSFMADAIRAGAPRFGGLGGGNVVAFGEGSQ